VTEVNSSLATVGVNFPLGGSNNVMLLFWGIMIARHAISVLGIVKECEQTVLRVTHCIRN